MANKNTDEIDKMCLREKIEFITGEKDSPFCDMAELMASEYEKQLVFSAFKENYEDLVKAYDEVKNDRD